MDHNGECRKKTRRCGGGNKSRKHWNWWGGRVVDYSFSEFRRFVTARAAKVGKYGRIRNANDGGDWWGVGVCGEGEIGGRATTGGGVDGGRSGEKGHGCGEGGAREEEVNYGGRGAEGERIRRDRKSEGVMGKIDSELESGGRPCRS
ncbi:hypothetical protein Tco_0706165 [Tanacetum coccineum]|uniref:Uncharacterized protein n=1 Tax=Tanacetum coccineum TaxID=301880 RepID=A0ABQ4Y6P4_9ASTR